MYEGFATGTKAFRLLYGPEQSQRVVLMDHIVSYRRMHRVEELAGGPTSMSHPFTRLYLTDGQTIDQFDNWNLAEQLDLFFGVSAP